MDPRLKAEDDGDYGTVGVPVLRTHRHWPLRQARAGERTETVSETNSDLFRRLLGSRRLEHGIEGRVDDFRPCTWPSGVG